MEHHQFESAPSTGIIKLCGIRNPIRMNNNKTLIVVNAFFMLFKVLVYKVNDFIRLIYKNGICFFSVKEVFLNDR